MLEWEASLSNGENWTRKQLYKIGDITPFKRLIQYAIKNNLEINGVKILTPSGIRHLPSNKGKHKSILSPCKYWYMVYERFAGSFGGVLKSVEKLESLSCRIGDNRLFIWVDEFGNDWIQLVEINDPKIDKNLENKIDEFYECDN